MASKTYKKNKKKKIKKTKSGNRGTRIWNKTKQMGKGVGSWAYEKSGKAYDWASTTGVDNIKKGASSIKNKTIKKTKELNIKTKKSISKQCKDTPDCKNAKDKCIERRNEAIGHLLYYDMPKTNIVAGEGWSCEDNWKEACKDQETVCEKRLSNISDLEKDLASFLSDKDLPVPVQRDSVQAGAKKKKKKKGKKCKKCKKSKKSKGSKKTKKYRRRS